jgi:LPS export ABC transporter permease LptG/LPS export ABC transporter permease LptF
MLKKLDKYILKEITPPFILGLSIYTFTMLLNNIQQIADDMVIRGTSLWVSIKMILYLLPFILSYTIPMSVLMGVLAGLSRMSSDSEIIALKTMGIKNSRIYKPVFIFSLTAFIISAFLGMYVSPPTQFESTKLWLNVLVSKKITNIRPQTICNEFNQYILYFENKSHTDNTWENVLLYPIDSGEDENIILARTGKLNQSAEKEYFFSLTDVILHRFNRNENSEENYGVASFKFKTEQIRTNLRYKIQKKPHHMQFHELLEELKTKPGDRRILKNLYGQLTQPLSALVLAFLGLSLGISTRKAGKASGFVISLGVLFLYYTMIMSGETMIKKKLISPFLGMWGPLLILFTAGIILYYKTSREMSFNWEYLISAFNLLKIKLEQLKTGLFRSANATLKYHRLLKVLDLYIIKRILFLFLLLLLSLLAIFFILNILENIDDAIDNQVSIFIVFKYVIFKIPDYMGFITPIAALTAVLITFSLMSKNNETTAIQASGISIYRLVIPTVIFGIMLSLGFFLFQETLIPPANEIATKLFNKIRGRDDANTLIIKRGVKAGPNKFYFYNLYKPTEGEFTRFNVIWLTDKFQIKKRIFARKAIWQNERELILKDGFIKEFKNLTPISHKSFQSHLFQVVENKTVFESDRRFSRFMNIKNIRKYIKYLKSNQIDSAKYRAKLYKNYAFPFTSLIMILIAIPFSFKMGKKGTLFGIGIAIGISMVYWWLSALFNSLGQTTIISPFLAAFTPMILFLSISIVMLFIFNR